MTLLDDFARIFQLPPAMLPHIEFVAQEQEIALVVALGNGPLTAPQIAEKLALPLDETEATLQNAYTRSIVNREAVDGVMTYTHATFSERLDPLSMYENWRDVPADARAAVVQWQFEEFIKTWQPEVEALLIDPDKPTSIPNRDVLLLEEALAMVDAASEYVVVPCDCRSIVMACDRPRETCIRLDEDARKTLERGHGRRLTKDEMRQVVIKANRAGLMASGDRTGASTAARPAFATAARATATPSARANVWACSSAGPAATTSPSGTWRNAGSAGSASAAAISTPSITTGPRRWWMANAVRRCSSIR